MKEKEKKSSAAPQKETSSSNSMMNKLLPHIVAIVVFAAITIMYFSPMILDNKQMSQSDIIQFKGVSKEIQDYREKTGKEALWTNSMFGGMPAFQISVDYKGNLIQYIDKIMSLGFPHPSELLLLSFLCFYILLILVGVNSWLAIAGAIAYALCSFNLILLQAGHNSELHAIALMPLVAAGVIMLRNEKYLLGGTVTAIALSLLVYANHLQITFYLLLAMLVYAIVEVIYAVREKNYKNLLMMAGIVAVAGIFSLLTNLSLLWSTYEYVPSTIRGPSELSSNKQSTGGLDKDYAFQWSYDKMESFTLLIPNFYGGSSNEDVGTKSHTADVLRSLNLSDQQIAGFTSRLPTYWGSVPFTSGPVYVGAILCFLFLLSLFMVKERWKWWLLATAILSLFLAWGKNFSFFNDIMFNYFPGYNKFRTPSMALVLVPFSFAFLVLVFLNHLLKGDYKKEEIKKQLMRSVIVVGGLCLLFVVVGSSFLSFSTPNDDQFRSQLMQASGKNQQFVDQMLQALKDDRASLLRTDAFRSLAFILLAAGLIWLFINGRVKQKIFLGGIAVLMFLDLYPVGKRYLTSDEFVDKNKYNQYFEATPADDLINKETSKDYRVFNLVTDTWNDSRTSYFHESVGGYHAAKLRRFQEIIEHQLTKNDSLKGPYPFNKSVIDMLNTKYIIVPGQNQQEQVIPNTDAMGNAWFVDSVKMVANADAEMSALYTFNPNTTAIVDKRFASQFQGLQPSRDSTASVTLDSYSPNDLKYSSKSSKDNVIVFSEIYYQPGWNAYVDGKKADHFRCNYILRGMRVPAGNHNIEFKFEPESFYAGENVAYGSSGLLLLIAIGGLFRERKRIFK